MYRLSDFNYYLPQELIAQYPSPRRDLCRLLVLNRHLKSIQHRRFCDIVHFLDKGDLLVLNDTKVIPARLIGQRRTKGKVEVLLLREIDGCDSPPDGQRCHALIKPLGRLREGEEIFFNHGFSCRLMDAQDKIVEFKGTRVAEIMRTAGQVPLPPYIRRPPDSSDRRRYQTIFARREGAVAAPTAGLHFTKKVLAALKNKGVRIAYLTLHINYATFSPVRSQDIRQHRMSEEYFEIPPATVEQLHCAKKNKKRVIAVGTTVCKALEDNAEKLLREKKVSGKISGWSNFFIYPPFSFKMVDALITNFHLPRTTLLMLAAAFTGWDLLKQAYQEAIEQRYRFYSYGDAMLIL